MRNYSVLLLFFISANALWAQQEITIQQAIADYDYERALALVDKEEPTSDNLHQKSLILKGLNRYHDAINVLKRIILQEPGNKRALIELAECYRISGKPDEALVCYDQLLSLSPGHKYARMQYISLLNSLERYDHALRVCEEALENDSTDNALMRLMGQIHTGRNYLPDAVGYYRKAIANNPDDNISVARLANIFIQLNLLESALEVTENYRQRDTANLYVNRMNAQAYCLFKDYDTAIDRYSALVHRGDSSRLTCYYLGMSYYAKAKYYDAYDFLSIAYEYTPEDVNVLYYLGRTCAVTSWKKRGIELLEKAIDVVTPTDSTMSWLYAGLAECGKYEKNQKKRIYALKEQYKYDKGNHQILYNIGVSYFSAGDYQNYEKYINMYKKLRSDQPDKERDKVIDKTIETIKIEQFFKGEL